MKKIIFFLSLYLFTYVAKSQNNTDPDTSQRILQLDEVVVSANKFAEKKKNIAQQILIVSSKEIKRIGAGTTADLLANTGNVAVQKSQLGGGSLILRGFEASRVLMVIDGVRLNNAIYRAGHLQNVITLDNSILDRVEVLYGPSSTIYGSDALGGVVHFHTKNPILSGAGKTATTGNAFLRYGTAADEFSGHVDVSVGGKKFGFLSAFTYSDFNDLRQGANRNSKIGNLGLRNFYQQRINGIDSMVANSNPAKQKFTGYHQYDILQKLLYKPSDKISHLLSLQFSNSSDIPRYDRLTETSGGIFKSAEWYYGPQKRNLFSYELNAQNLSFFFKEIKAVASYQQIEESRNNRNWKSARRNERVEKLGVVGFTVDARRKSEKNELTVGIDGQFNDVKSRAQRVDILTGALSKLDTRYPDGKNKMNYYAVYASDIYKINSNWVFNSGLRFNYVTLHSTFVDTAILHLPFTSAEQNHATITGNLGIIYLTPDNWKFSLLASSGFRSPNLDDLTKVFETFRGVKVTVPNQNLKPEYTYNIDLNISKVIAKKVKLEATGYYTFFKNVIVSDRFTFNGQSSIIYDGVLTPVFANQNKAKAYVVGLNAAVTADISSHFSVYSTLNFTKGRYKNSDGTKSPLDHISPAFGRTSIVYRNKKINAEIFSIYNAAKKSKDYNQGGEDNQIYSVDPVNGYLPGWFTANVRSSYQFHKYFSIQAALENIFDRNYRTFASGISAPGRNLIITLRASL
ncbi:MAG TPA: TonB-dependent receptor [Chitinophagaceae bacterium]|nr:TonB-dependent receptor [Chitinophagaceae bacterium]